MSSPDWTAVVQAYTAIGTLGVSILGFWILIYQVLQLKKVVHSDTHSRLFAEDYEAVKFFVDRPNLRPYFYDNKVADAASGDTMLADVAAELFCVHFEQVVLQMENLPEHIRLPWKRYVRGMYASSPAIRRHLDENRDWYSQRLHDLVSDRTS